MGVLKAVEWPLAPKDTAWDADAARKRIFEWAGGPGKENIDWGKVKKCFLFVRSEDGEGDLTSYLFPYVDIIGGTPKIVFRAVVAIIQVLNGARQGVGLSEKDKEAVYREVAKLYRLFGEEPPELKRSFDFIERRSFPADSFSVREEGENTLSVIEGYAAVFDQFSELLGDFREVIRPGAFKKSIENGADVRALWNHDPNFVLGRTKNGTLFLEEDEKGLKVRIIPPNTTWARDLVESIRRGDVDQMSFGFKVVRENWIPGEDGGVIRELLEVDLFDVSPVTFPAYPTTSVAVRSVEDILKNFRAGIQGDTSQRQTGNAQGRLLVLRRMKLDLAEKF